MKSLLAILIMFLGAAVGAAQTDGLGAFKFEKKQAGHRALVTFSTRLFEPQNHKISKDHTYQTRVDGRLAYGTDGNVPKVGISVMKFELDGKEIRIPKRFYSDLFEPNLEGSHVTVRFLNNFQSVIVSMSGSDGAGGYQARWRLRASGIHARSINTF